ncbi:Zinc finger protein 862 [Anabarilius grahami]|uniref:Zinc finger protein 862 n=1 Tax=Anabarilius grahami TaxID=495550 RepID=A0A3N0XPN1_ANAGA|nr:Zinc finger protein 862 [Anabarilius grahami]
MNKGLAVGKTYRNANQAQVFMHYIAEVERRKVKEEISANKFISIMADGSTDSSVMEEELVYTRMSRAGKVKVQFVGIQALKKADAACITDAICSQMSAVSGGEEEWKEKLVACGTDGAAVMTGSKTGVVSRLRGERTYILGVHCMAHRLELAFKDVMKTNSHCRKVEDLLTGLFTLYHRSPLNRAKLKDSFSVLGIKPLMPTRVGGTRPGPMLRKVLDSNTYMGVNLRHSDTSHMMANKDKLLDKLSDSMDNRFGDVGSGILSDTKIVSFQQWPDPENSADFGDSEVDRLTSHFKPILISSGVDVDLIADQWTIIKSCLYKEPQTLEKITWAEVNRMLRETCPDFLDLVDLVLCMPASTAHCERGFNVMKMVKSDWRSSLKCETLSDLLFVHLSSPSIKDFDPSTAVEMCHASSIRSRRPDLMEDAAAAEVEEEECICSFFVDSD